MDRMQRAAHQFTAHPNNQSLVVFLMEHYQSLKLGSNAGSAQLVIYKRAVQTVVELKVDALRHLQTGSFIVNIGQGSLDAKVRAVAALRGALRDARLGEEVAAWIILHPNAALTVAALQDWCREKIARFKVPRYIRFGGEMPVTATGKPQKFKMQEAMCAELGIALTT